MIEGTSEHPRTIVIKFKSRASAQAWYDSPAYREALPLRLAACEGVAMLVDGYGRDAALDASFDHAHFAGRRFVLQSAALGVRLGAAGDVATLLGIDRTLKEVEEWWVGSQAAQAPEWARLTMGQGKIW